MREAAPETSSLQRWMEPVDSPATCLPAGVAGTVREGQGSERIDRLDGRAKGRGLP